MFAVVEVGKGDIKNWSAVSQWRMSGKPPPPLNSHLSRRPIFTPLHQAWWLCSALCSTNHADKVCESKALSHSIWPDFFYSLLSLPPLTASEVLGFLHRSYQVLP